MEKEAVKLPLFTDGMILYVENSKESHLKTIRTGKYIQHEYRLQDQFTKSVVFLYTSNKQSENEIKRTIPF